MNIYNVTVRTQCQRHTYQALGPSSIAVHIDALNRFGGLCSVSVKPA